MIKTRTAAILHLVSKGVPQNLAKASVHEAYTADNTKPAETELLLGYMPACDNREEIAMSTDAIEWMHEIVMDSIGFMKGGIAVEGVLKYNMNGDLL